MPFNILTAALARAQIKLIAGTGYTISTDSLNPSNLLHMQEIGATSGLLFDPTDGSIRNITGRTITLTGNISLQAEVLSSASPEIHLASSRSMDKVAWLYNDLSHRRLEVSGGSETVLNTASFIVELLPSEYAKFSFYVTNGTAGLVSRTALFEGQTVSGFTILWGLEET